MPRIITLTLNPAIDKSTTVPGLLAEHKMRCTPPKFEPGGGGINVTRALRKLGGESTAFYLAGGYSGQFFTELLQREGVNAQPLPIAQPTRENLIVVDTATNQQYRFGMDGPQVSEPEWQHALDVLSQQTAVDFLVGSGSLPPGVPTDFYGKLANVAQIIGAKLILDTSGEALRQAVGKGVYLLKPNLRELSALAGVEELELDEIDDAALEIIRRGDSQIIVVSLGAQGALLVSEDVVEHVKALTVKKRSTVGAGDSMVAGMTLALSWGWPLPDVVRYGVACGTAATMNAGTELCRPQDVERLFRKV
ncbi:MAG: 1-phosphofructokinase family hexose kinase [Cytophagaceae bacterium]|nr:1-phosphofructokinase family hexose kinase [Cytophagaceae bacterium]